MEVSVTLEDDCTRYWLDDLMEDFWSEKEEVAEYCKIGVEVTNESIEDEMKSVLDKTSIDEAL